LVRWKYIDENGLFDARGKQYIEKFAEVDELDYYIRALKNQSAIPFVEEIKKITKSESDTPDKIVEEFHKNIAVKTENRRNK